jgi:acyl dehydratase
MSHEPAPSPMTRYFEDYRVGEVAKFGDYEITSEEIITFAKRYDPQLFHIDPEAAKQSSFGGLVASGWMSAGVLMRLLVDHYISPLASMGSPGVDELRWHKPVKPGDRLHARVEVVGKRRSQSKPDRGLIHFVQQGFNQQSELVISFRGMGMCRCRSLEPGPDGI